MKPKYTIIVELASTRNPDLTVFGYGDYSTPISTQLNKDKNRLYVTNCQKMYSLIKYKLLPHTQERLILVDLSDKHGSLFIPKLGNVDLLMSTMGDRDNFVVINALGDFDTIVRNKLINLSASLPHIQLNLISHLVASSRNIKTLVVPNDCNNLAFCIIESEILSSMLGAKLTIATDFAIKISDFAQHDSLQSFNRPLLDGDIELTYRDLDLLDLKDFDRIYVDFGQGVTDKGFQNILDNTSHAQQLSLYNHEYLSNYSSNPHLSFDGIITNEMLLNKKQLTYSIPGSVQRQSFDDESSSLISTNPLD